VALVLLSGPVQHFTQTMVAIMVMVTTMAVIVITMEDTIKKVMVVPAIKPIIVITIQVVVTIMDTGNKKLIPPIFKRG